MPSKHLIIASCIVLQWPYCVEHVAITTVIDLFL